ncbi:MAG TPA: carboxypeptidase-like regulatory domain-containing protein, partial [Pyrinomonadaceae bacterium]|nr:carboxypeptidase-like regulatory domain-containing protein [Pyrinomonadaceae bacterium]
MSGRTSRRLLAVIVFVLLPSFAAEEVRACDCLFGGSAVCQEFWEMDVVFAGTVVGTSEIATEPANYKRRLVRFSVEQSYRGGAGAFVEVVTGRGGGDCGYGFKQGGQYLVYARRNEHDRKLYTGICTRTRRLAEADADLAFFRGLATAEAAGSVFGTVVKRNYEWKEGEEPFKPVANAELSVEGETARYELKSDAEGNFRFERLAPGTYKVKLRLPPGLTYGEEDETTRTVGYDVEVSARGCAEADFHLVADGRVGGHVVDASARPAANLRLEMRGATSDARNVNTFLYTDTNAEGAFEFKRVPPGDYWFGVRLLSSSGGEIAPYPRTYFPGVTARAQASVVSLKEGERRSGLEFRLTPRLAEY